MYLLVDFLVLRVVIWYNIMIPLSPLSLIIIAPHQIFANFGMDDTSHDTFIVTSLFPKILNACKGWPKFKIYTKLAP
jgi:hypothetical protein